jgi:hypothetical protein
MSFLGKNPKSVSMGEKIKTDAFDKTVAALQRKENARAKKAEEARERRHDDLGGKYVPNKSKKLAGIETPGDSSGRGGGKKRRKSRSKKRRKSRSKKRRKSRSKKRRKSRRKRRKSRRVKKRR